LIQRFDDAQCRNDEDEVLSGKFGEAGLGQRIPEDVRQAINAGCYCVASVALRRDMGDDKSVAPVSRGDHVFKLLLYQSRKRILVDDFDVVPALRNVSGKTELQTPYEGY